MECSGAHAARNLGIELVLPRGALVLVGENAAPWTIEEGKVFRRKDFYMIRTFYFPISDFEPNVELLRRYKDEYRVLVDGEFGLSDLAGEFRPVRQGRADQARAGAGLSDHGLDLDPQPRQALRQFHRHSRSQSGDRGPRVRRVRRPVRLRQVDPAADHRRPRADLVGRSLHRRQARQRRPGGAARHRDGVPGLCALSAHARLRQHVVCAGAARNAEGRDRRAGEARRRAAAYRALSRPQAEGTVRRPAPARRDGPRDRAQSQRRSCSTSRCPTSTPSCAGRCAPRSRRCRSS